MSEERTVRMSIREAIRFIEERARLDRDKALQERRAQHEADREKRLLAKREMCKTKKARCQAVKTKPKRRGGAHTVYPQEDRAAIISMAMGGMKYWDIVDAMGGKYPYKYIAQLAARYKTVGARDSLVWNYAMIGRNFGTLEAVRA